MEIMAAGYMGIMLLFGLAGSGNDFFDSLPLKEFWQNQKVTVSADSMKAILVDAPATDVSDSIEKLGSERFVDREKAYAALKRAGGSILPQLEKAATAAEDPEVRQRLKQLITEINQLNADRATLQMAALITIQRREYKQLLPVVKKLTENSNKMVAQYAEETVAKLEGKEYKRPVPSNETLLADLALLPSDVGTVAQVRPPKVNPEDVFKPFRALAGLGFPGGGGPGGFEAKMKEELVKAALRVGNVRVDSMVLGVSNEVGPRTGYVVFVFRGYYSPPALLKLIKEENRRLEKTTIDGMDVYMPDREFAMICPSNEQLILVGGPRHETLPLAKVINSLKAAPKEPTFSKESNELLAKVDRTKKAWAVSRMNDEFREAPPFAPFDWIVGEADQDAKGAVTMKFWGEGSDAELVAKTMTEMQTELDKAIAQMEKVGAAMPMIAPMMKIVKSIKLEHSGTKASVAMKIDDVSMIMTSPSLFLGMAFREAPAVEVGPAIEPEEVVDGAAPPPVRPVPKKRATRVIEVKPVEKRPVPGAVPVPEAAK